MLLHSPNRYGDADEVLAVAKKSGADAIHPGYGFLAEEADFAERCAAEGITFIGPGPGVITRPAQQGGSNGTGQAGRIFACRFMPSCPTGTAMDEAYLPSVRQKSVIRWW
jgi:pyruvate carboxylase